MRLWSLHPKYLDSAGLVACWREALLAKKVLQGETRGYRHHPQLVRFIRCNSPTAAIRTFLHGLASEASVRGFKFDKRLIGSGGRFSTKIVVTTGQLDYEFKHLMRKLKIRNPKCHRDLLKLKAIEPHPMFRPTPGEVERWEVVRNGRDKTK